MILKVSSNPRHSTILWLSPKTWITSLLESKDWAGGTIQFFQKRQVKIIWITPAYIFPGYSPSVKADVPYLEEKTNIWSYFQVPQCVFMLTVLKCLLCEPSVFHTFPVLPVTWASVEAPMFLKLFAFLLSPAGSWSFARAAAVSEHQLHSQAEPPTVKATRAVLCCTVPELF